MSTLIHTQTADPNKSEVRGAIRNENLDEQIRAAKNWNVGQQQYFTPRHIVEEVFGTVSAMMGNFETVIDPQAGDGSLVKHLSDIWTEGHPNRHSHIKYRGIEMDSVTVEKAVPGVQLIRGNCVELFPKVVPNNRAISVIVANPPFGLKWNLPGSPPQDSSEWTWEQIKTKCHVAGVLICLADKIREKGWDRDPKVFYYKTFRNVWKGVDREIGVIGYDPNLSGYCYTLCADDSDFDEIFDTQQEAKVLSKRRNVEFRKGVLDIYFSSSSKRQVEFTRLKRLISLDKSDPMILAIDRSTREALADLLQAEFWTISEEAKAAIEAALVAYNDSHTPVMPTTDYQDLAYLDVQDHLECIRDGDGEEVPVKFVKGKIYPISTNSRKITRTYKKKVLKIDSEGVIAPEEHTFESSGLVRTINISGEVFREMSVYDPEPFGWEAKEYDERFIWKYFKKPQVLTVAERYPDRYAANVARLDRLESFSGFRYFPGQKDFIARIGVKKFGVISAEVGCGKSLMAISLIWLQKVNRVLLIAPQATVRGDESEGKSAAQWLQEVETFAPFMQVFRIYTKDDYEDLRRRNGGELPNGVYISYWEAMFLNDSWVYDNPKKKDSDLGNLFGINASKKERIMSTSIGAQKEGIRCVASPTLADVVNGQFDMIIMDEAHKVKNPDAKTTGNMIRLQSEYRYLMTATPIPNSLKDMFTLMAWVSVPGWYKGGQKNSVWPFELGRENDFEKLFLTKEKDMTEWELSRSEDKSGPSAKAIPVVSNAATLLKLIGPIVGYIDKKGCSPAYQPGKLEVIRVGMETKQFIAYVEAMQGKFSAHITNRFQKKGHIQMMTREFAIDPKGASELVGRFDSSGITPKLVAAYRLLLEIVKDRGEQCVVLSARLAFTNTLLGWIDKAGIPTSRIDSSIQAKLQSREASRFKRGESRILLMGNQCAQAHSFPNCPNLILLAAEYSYGPLIQGFGRVDRINSKRPPNFYILLHRDSIEEAIFDKVGMKKDAATLALHGEMRPSEYVPMNAENFFAEALESFSLRGASVDETSCIRDLEEILKGFRK